MKHRCLNLIKIKKVQKGILPPEPEGIKILDGKILISEDDYSNVYIGYYFCCVKMNKILHLYNINKKYI